MNDSRKDGKGGLLSLPPKEKTVLFDDDVAVLEVVEEILGQFYINNMRFNCSLVNTIDMFDCFPFAVVQIIFLAVFCQLSGITHMICSP